MWAWRNFTETQQSDHALRSGPKIKNGRNSAKDGTPERLRCGTIQEEVSQFLQRVSTGTARRILPDFFGSSEELAVPHFARCELSRPC